MIGDANFGLMKTRPPPLLALSLSKEHCDTSSVQLVGQLHRWFDKTPFSNKSWYASRWVGVATLLVIHNIALVLMQDKCSFHKDCRCALRQLAVCGLVCLSAGTQRFRT